MPPVSHALAARTPVVGTAASPQVDGKAGALVADPTHLLSPLSLAEIQHLLAKAEGAGAAPPAPPAASLPAAQRPAHPWAWAWAAWESAAALYVALTEPQRRGPRTAARPH